MTAGGLKLRAEDNEDLAVISACLQDALIPLSEMDFFPEDRRFAMVANRFRWENCEDSRLDCGAYERINCGISFEDVTGVRYRDLDRSDRTQVLNLLTIEPGRGELNLVFAGGGVIALAVERVRCFVQDIGEPWPTVWRPAHMAADQS